MKRLIKSVDAAFLFSKLCLITPHCGLDKLPWHPGFVCNISAHGIMTAVMDDITGAVQQSPEQEAWWL